MTSPSLAEMEPEELRAAIEHLRRYDPGVFMQAIASIMGREDD